MDKERIEALDGLYEIIGYRFADITLANRAFTHGSYANENPDRAEDNERLEFLGDAVLQLCMSDMLIELFPGYAEGRLSKMRASMVNEQSLAKLARRFGIGALMLLGRGEEKAGGRDKDSILGDAFESLIGAIYLDGGYEASRACVRRIFGPLVEQWKDQPVYQDYKSLLQEATQSMFKEIPRYRILSTSGPDHDKTFEIEASIGNGITTRGTGKNKKEAEQDAARKALARLDEWHDR